MRHSRRLRLGAMLALATTVAFTLATAASAGQIFREAFHEEDTDVIDDFCGAAGLTVGFAFVVDGGVHAVPHGRDGLAYFGAHFVRTEVVTNVATGTSLTLSIRSLTGTCA
jgi:hypothetical protein